MYANAHLISITDAAAMVKKTWGQLLLSSLLHCEQIGAVKGNCFLLLQAQRRRRRRRRRVTRNSSPKCRKSLRKRINNRGVKWKFSGLFEQDKLYWTRTRKKELQDADESKEKERKVQKKSHTATSAAMRRGAAGSLTRKTRPNNPRRNAIVTSDDCASSADEPVVVGRNYIMEEKKEKLDQEGEITVVADEYSKGNHAVSDAGTAKKALPALLQAKCEVLTMEKELAMQRWRQQCVEMAKAAEMAQTLRASVETILEVTDSHFFLSSALFQCHGKLLLSFVAAEKGGDLPIIRREDLVHESLSSFVAFCCAGNHERQ